MQRTTACYNSGRGQKSTRHEAAMVRESHYGKRVLDAAGSGMSEKEEDTAAFS